MSLLTDNLFLEHLSIFMDLLKYQIDNPDDKVLDKKIEFDPNIIIEIEELVSYIKNLSHSEYRNIISEINNYLINVSVSQFMVDYIKCKSGIIINIQAIYKYNKKNKYMINYKKQKIININFNNFILLDGKLYVLTTNNQNIEPVIDDINEFTIDFLNERMTVYNKGDKNAFWTIYYLFEKHNRNELLFSVKQKIYDIKLLYDNAYKVHNDIMTNLVDVFGNLNMTTFNGYTDEQKKNDIEIFNKSPHYKNIGFSKLNDIFKISK